MYRVQRYGHSNVKRLPENHLDLEVMTSLFQDGYKLGFFPNFLKESIKVAFHSRKFEFKVFRNIHLNGHNL